MLQDELLQLPVLEIYWMKLLLIAVACDMYYYVDFIWYISLWNSTLILLEQAAFSLRYLPEIMLSHSRSLRIEFEVYIFWWMLFVKSCTYLNSPHSWRLDWFKGLYSDLFKTTILLLFGLFFEGFIILYYIWSKKFELCAASHDLWNIETIIKRSKHTSSFQFWEFHL